MKTSHRSDELKKNKKKGEEGGGSAGPMINKQVENCFLNHNSSTHFCCTDSLLMTHRGGPDYVLGNV
jgi:hypothetical protein